MFVTVTVQSSYNTFYNRKFFCERNEEKEYKKIVDSLEDTYPEIVSKEDRHLSFCLFSSPSLSVFRAYYKSPLTIEND